MATKLQELLEELKELKEFSPFTSEINTTLISKIELEQLITKYTETTPTYKPGDNVRVTKHLHGHGFDKGTIVTLCALTKNNFWKCASEDDVWYLMEEEFEPIK